MFVLEAICTFIIHLQCLEVHENWWFLYQPLRWIASRPLILLLCTGNAFCSRLALHWTSYSFPFPKIALSSSSFMSYALGRYSITLPLDLTSLVRSFFLHPYALCRSSIKVALDLAYSFFLQSSTRGFFFFFFS